MGFPVLGGLALSGLGAGLGGMFGSSAAKDQIRAMREAIEYQKQKDAQTRADLAPYRDFGGTQLNALSGWLNDPNKQPSSYLDPGYGFRRSEGMKGVTGNAATAGLLQSGDTLRGLEQYGQGLASEEYGNAFNRWLQEGGFRQGLAGMGQNAAVSGGYLANQGAANIGNLYANTDWGGPKRVWGDVLSGMGGMGGNAFSRMFGGAKTPGGSNVFAGSAGPNGMAWPW